MTVITQNLADLSSTALLIVLGAGFFGLLLRGELRFRREVEAEKAEKVEWKAVATQMTAVNAQQATQITQLTEMLERVIPKVNAHGSIRP